MTPLKTFALICIGEIAKAERDSLDPSEFFGFEEEIKAIQADPKAAVKAVVDREFDIDWDMDKSLRRLVIERFKVECAVDRAEAHLAVKDMKLDAARKVLANHRANGGLSRMVVEEAQKVVADSAEEAA